MAKNPNLELAQWFFLLTIDNNAAIRQKLLDAIRENNMAPFYKHVRIWKRFELMYLKVKLIFRFARRSSGL